MNLRVSVPSIPLTIIELPPIISPLLTRSGEGVEKVDGVSGEMIEKAEKSPRRNLFYIPEVNFGTDDRQSLSIHDWIRVKRTKSPVERYVRSFRSLAVFWLIQIICSPAGPSNLSLPFFRMSSDPEI